MSGTFSISGIVSGIDWDSMIDKLVENASNVVTVKESKKTDLTNKKSLLEEYQVALQALQSSLTALKLPSTYRAKSVEVERLDSNGSAKGVLTASVNADAKVGLHDIVVKQLATNQVQRSKSFSSTNGSLASIFNSGSLQGLSSSTFKINVGGAQREVTVRKTDTINDLAENINAALKTGEDLGVTASVVDGRLILTSDYTGLGEEEKTQKFTISATDPTESLKLTDMDIDLNTLYSGGAVFELTDGTNNYELGKDFDIVKTYDSVNDKYVDEIRWRSSNPNTTKADDTYKVTYTAVAGDTWSGKVTRGDDNEDIDSHVLPFALNNGSGTFTITDGTTEYQSGVDFYVNGTSIRWLTTGTAQRPEEGSEYTVTYTVDPGKTTDVTFEIDRSGNDQIGVTLNSIATRGITCSQTRTSGATETLSGISSVPTDAIVDVWDENGNVYQEGLDFTISGGSITWLSDRTALSPDEGTNYTVTVTNPKLATITCGSETYTEGVDFDIIGDENGNACVKWRAEAAASAPQSGENYTLEIYSIDSTGAESTTTKTLTRSSGDTVNMADYGFTSANGIISSVTFDGKTQTTGSISDCLRLSRSSDGTSVTIGNSSVINSTDQLSFTYVAKAGNIYNSKLASQKVRITDLNTDVNISSFTNGVEFDLSSDTSDFYLTTAPGATKYFKDADFTINDDGKIVWNSGHAPIADDDYYLVAVLKDNAKITFNTTASAGDTIDITTPSGQKYGLQITGSNYGTIESVTDVTLGITKDFTVSNATVTNNTYGTDVRPKVTLNEASDRIEITYTANGNERYNTPGAQRRTLSASGDNISDMLAFDLDLSTIQRLRLMGSNGDDFFMNIAFDLDEDGNVSWKSGVTPDSGATYYAFVTFKDGAEITINTTPTSTTATSATVDFSTIGFMSAPGTITNVENVSARELDVKANNNGSGQFTINWGTGTKSEAANTPAAGANLTATYTYKYNTFTMDDNGSGLLDALELNNFDSDHYTAAQDAILEVNGVEVHRSYNNIGESYDNAIEGLEGVTLKLKGAGQVVLDISHDLSATVEAVQTTIDNYNDILSWINTRMTESELDEDKVATVDSDDFRMRWGLLRSSSLLRNSKQRMRTISSQNYTYTFSSRTSAKSMYGTLEQNNITTNQTLTIKVGDKTASFTVTPQDTLASIAKMINDSTDSQSNPAYNLHYDDDGKQITPLAKATVSGGKLTLKASGSQGTEVQIGGSSSLLKAIGMNYTYVGLYQIGITTTSDNYGESGELEFDTSEFMEVAEDNTDELEGLVMAWANELNTWTTSMLRTSADQYGGKGTLINEIEGIDSQISSINEWISNFNDRMDTYRARLQKKFTAAETALSDLMTQASTLSQLTSMLSSSSSSDSSDSSSS